MALQSLNTLNGIGPCLARMSDPCACLPGQSRREDADAVRSQFRPELGNGELQNYVH